LSRATVVTPVIEEHAAPRGDWSDDGAWPGFRPGKIISSIWFSLYCSAPTEAP
jgi:hypothetical protein